MSPHFSLRNKHSGKPTPTKKNRAAYYTPEEDRLILEYVGKKPQGNLSVTGIKFWQNMEDEGVIEGRTWHSLKERYIKRLCKGGKRQQKKKDKARTNRKSSDSNHTKSNETQESGQDEEVTYLPSENERMNSEFSKSKRKQGLSNTAENSDGSQPPKILRISGPSVSPKEKPQNSPIRRTDSAKLVTNVSEDTPRPFTPKKKARRVYTNVDHFSNSSDSPTQSDFCPTSSSNSSEEDTELVDVVNDSPPTAQLDADCNDLTETLNPYQPVPDFTELKWRKWKVFLPKKIPVDDVPSQRKTIQEISRKTQMTKLSPTGPVSSFVNYSWSDDSLNWRGSVCKVRLAEPAEKNIDENSQIIDPVSISSGSSSSDSVHAQQLFESSPPMSDNASHSAGSRFPTRFLIENDKIRKRIPSETDECSSEDLMGLCYPDKGALSALKSTNQLKKVQEPVVEDLNLDRLEVNVSFKKNAATSPIEWLSKDACTSPVAGLLKDACTSPVNFLEVENETNKVHVELNAKKSENDQCKMHLSEMKGIPNHMPNKQQPKPSKKSPNSSGSLSSVQSSAKRNIATRSATQVVSDRLRSKSSSPKKQGSK